MCQRRRKPNVSVCQDCLTHLLTCCKKLLFRPKPRNVHPRISTHNMKSKSEKPNCTTPKIKSNSNFEPMFSTYKRQLITNSEEAEFSIFSFFWYWKCWPQKEGFACAPPGYVLSKETRYWLLHTLGGTQHICKRMQAVYCHLCPFMIIYLDSDPPWI